MQAGIRIDGCNSEIRFRSSSVLRYKTKKGAAIHESPRPKLRHIKTEGRRQAQTYNRLPQQQPLLRVQENLSDF